MRNRAFRPWGALGLALLLGGSAVSLAQPPSAASHRAEGLLYRQQEQWPEAIAQFRSAIQLEPENVQNYVLLGWTQHLAGQSREAATTLWAGIVRQPLAVASFNALGIVYLVRGEAATAIVLHSWAALLQRENEIAHYNLSLAYHQRGLFGLAQAHARYASSLEPQNPHPLLALAIAQWQQGDRAAARDSYQAALGLNPQYGDRTYRRNLERAGFLPSQIALVDTLAAELTSD